MKKIFLFFALQLCGAFLFAQQSQQQKVITFDWLRYVAPKNICVPEYTPLPNEYPSNPGGSTLLNSATMGSSITQAELGTGIKNGITNGYANTLRANGLSDVLFKTNAYPTYATIGGPTIPTGSILMGQTGGTISNNVVFAHLVGECPTTVASCRGAGWTGQAGGSSVTFYDVIWKNTQSPGIQINGTGAAGTYNNIVLNFARVFGDPTANEAFYLGETSTTGYGVINNLTITNAFGYNKGWDGLQSNSVQNFNADKVTIYRVGRDSLSGQKSLLQLQNVGNNAVLSNSFFYRAPQAFQVSGRSVTFTNDWFYSSEAGLYQDLITSGYTTPLSSPGGTVYFINCHFGSDIPRAYAIEIRENQANFVFINCTIDSNIGNLIFDNRTDKITYSITQTGTSILEFETPIFNSLDKNDPEAGKLTNKIYRCALVGYRN